MNRFALMTTVALFAAVAGATPAAVAGTGVTISVGDDCCWRPYHSRHSYYYDEPGWRRPVYVVPPPIVYQSAPPVVIYGAPPPQRAVNAAPASAAYVDGSGRTCREYQTSVVVGGASRPAYGTACLQPDGSWRIVR